VASLVLTACKSRDAQRAADLETAISWLATAEAVAQGWAANRLPTEYAQRTLDDARRDLSSAGNTSAAAVVSALGEVVRRRDRDGMEEPLSTLRDERQLLEDTRKEEARSP